MTQIGEMAKQMIVQRTQDKGQIVIGGRLQQNPPLQPSTVERRSRTQLSPKTTPSTSNLTETGDMLDSLTVVATKNKVSVRLSGNKNKAKARFVSVKRPFLLLANQEIEQIKKFIKSLV